MFRYAMQKDPNARVPSIHMIQMMKIKKVFR